MYEKQIEQAVCAYASTKGLLVYKFASPNHLGVPDRVFLVPGGKVFFIEFKRRGLEMTPMQKREQTRIERMGSFVYVVDDVDRGKRLIDALIEGFEKSK
jgi:hypothetical protein